MRIEINCVVGTSDAARRAVEGGASWLTLTLPPLAVSEPFELAAAWFDEIAGALALARRRGVRSAVALPLRAGAQGFGRYEQLVSAMAHAGVDALVLSDLGLLAYAREHEPQVALHLSPQAALANAPALAFFARQFGVRRACLPGTLDAATVARIARSGHAEVEVFGFGSAGAMIEGLCSLSAYFSGESATRSGACTPARVVSVTRSTRFRSARLGGILIDSAPHDTATSHPTMCSGRYRLGSQSTHLFGGRPGAATLEALPLLARSGVRAVRLAPCGAAPSATDRVLQAWREAIEDCCHDPERFRVRPEWSQALALSQTALPCTVSVATHR